MEKVFGLPATGLAITMAVLLLFIFFVIALSATRRFILVKMGTRNIPRRKGQSILIVVGLMLSSAIIATSLGIGDTVRYSIRSVTLDALGPTDETIKGPGKEYLGGEYFDYSHFTRIEQTTRGNTSVRALVPVINISLPASNERNGLAENNVKVRGIDSGYSNKFDTLKNVQGEPVFIDALNSDEIYVNSKLSEVLKITRGEPITVYTRSGRSDFTVVDILESGGLAGGGTNPYILFDLGVLQTLLGEEGQITTIYVSNRGMGESSLDLSGDVSDFLRSELTDKAVAQEIFDVLKGSGIPALLSKESENLRDEDKDMSENLAHLSSTLSSNIFDQEFIKEIIGYQTQLVVTGILDKAGYGNEAMKVAAASSSLTILRVEESKKDGLELAENVAGGVTTIFSIFGSFSIMVGMLLIFLVFVLLAAARSTELGMARAVGLKRRDLVQLFTYEGTVYALIAALLGTAAGVALSFGLVLILQDLIDTDNFSIKPYYSGVSLLIAFSSGLILPFVTVVFSAYRASNLNIVVAIRGLRDEFVKKPPQPTREKLYAFLWIIIFPVRQLKHLITGDGNRLGNLLLLVGFPISWPISILISLVTLSGRHFYIVLGLLSMALLLSGIITETGASFFIGLTGFVLALGLFVRFIASKFIYDSESVNQLGGTFEGGLVLLANSLPFDFFETWTGELSEPGPWFWPVGGAISTAAAVWLLMSNTRILIALLNLVLSRFSGLRAVTKTAISYPMASKFRTGLTVAMFALIIFTLMIFSVLNGIGDITSEEPERVTGGYDIKGSISRDLPIAGDIRDSLMMSDFTVVAGASNVPIEVRELEGGNNIFKSSKLVSLEDEFFQTTKWKMAHFDPKYGSSEQDIWKNLAENPNLVVANASVIPSGDPFGPPDRSFKTSYVEPGDVMEMQAFPVEIRERKAAVQPHKLLVIGIVERLASGTGWGADSATFYSSRHVVPKIVDENVPFDTFYFSLRDRKMVSDYSQKLERTFLAHSMNAENLMKSLEDENATGDAFNKLFQGFSGLGLVVGVAAIGVLSVRAVVERRQSIGVLRAIGFRSGMIRAQFLIESSFITLLGIVVGIFLGILQSWLIFLEISKELEGAKFVVPIADVGVLIIITIVASILASVIPANEASKTYPAEALRYE